MYDKEDMYTRSKTKIVLKSSAAIIAKYNEGNIREAMDMVESKLYDISSLVHGETLLNIACTNGDLSMVQLLIDEGVEIREYDNSLITAYTRSDVDIFKELLTLDVDSTTLLQLFTDACLNNNPEFVLIMIKSKKVKAPIHLVVQLFSNSHKYEQIVKLFIKHGISINKVLDERGTTPFMLICKQGSNEFIYSLFWEGSVVFAPNYNGDNVMAQIDLITYLCEHSALRQYVIKLFIETNHTTDLFIKHGLNVNMALDNTGITPFMIMCKRGSVELVSMMIRKGASVNTPDYQGKRPIQYAYSAGNEDVLTYLNQYILDNRATDDVRRKRKRDL